MSEKELNNLGIWEQVKKTDPAHTKANNQGQRKETSISGTYMIMRATDVFGPIGTGWGYVIEEERFDNGAAFYDKDGTIAGHTMIHTIRIGLWYLKDNGEKSELIQHFGHTPFIRNTRNGPSTDMDASKKSLTDAIKKCLSMLGFSADIFLGMYEDYNYVEELKVESDIAKAENSDDELQKKRDEFYEWLTTEIEGYPNLPTMRALKLAYTGHITKVDRQCRVLKYDDSSVAKIKSMLQEAMEAQKAELEKSK
jgi:hypothetical protein